MGAGRAFHHAGFGGLERQHHGQRDGADHVDPQDLRRRNRQGQAQQHRRHQRHRLAAVDGQQEGDGLAQVVVHRAAFFDRVGDGGEVVVGQHDGAGLLGGFGAFAAHGHAHVGLLQGGRVVDAVARHGHHFAAGLQGLHQPQLVFGAGAGEHVHLLHALAQGGVVHGLDLGAGHRAQLFAHAQLGGNGAGGDGVVAGDHLDADARRLALRHRADGFVARRVDDADQAQQRHALGHIGMGQRPTGGQVAPGQRQHAAAFAGLGVHGL
jgi:hypothetical protein